MKIKKYISKTIAEGQRRIKEELGEDAIILSTREIIKPPNNEKFIEFVAAIDNDINPVQSATKEAIARNALDQIKNIKKINANKKRVVNTNRGMANVAKKAYQSNKNISNSENNELFISQFNKLKNQLDQIQSDIKYKYSGSLNSVFDELFKLLIDTGISEALTLQIIGSISTNMLNVDIETAKREARRLLTNEISIATPLQKRNRVQNVIFVGPTGSGKTSVLVKIAVVLKLLQQANVLIVSADTYKVGSVEQLQTFASIAGLPFKAVYTPEELAELVDCENTRDYILIDTTGRSPYQLEQIKMINEFITSIHSDTIYYVQSATTQGKVFRETLEVYKSLNPNEIILTKVDEVSSIGGIIEVLRDTDLPLSYIATGQQIPDDIEPAEYSLLSKLTLKNK